MGQFFTEIFTGIRIADIADVLIVSFIIYQLLGYLKSSRAAQLAKGLIIIVVCAFIANICQLYVLSWIISKILSVGAVALVIVFQPELRRALDAIGRSKIGISQSALSAEYTKDLVDEMLRSVEYFSERKEGAIIVIEQQTALSDVAESGTILDTRVSAEAINNIFYKGAPLHDGAVIIRGDRIYAAGCVLPLTQNQNISKDLGTRHRAALGISEESDALVLVVSEETGIISIARNGKLSRFLDLKTVEKQLLDCYQLSGYEDSIIVKLGNMWRKINGKKQDN